MARRKIYEVDKRERYRMLDEFFQMVAQIKTKQTAASFFKDLLTPSESLMLVRRIEIAKLLLAGWNYRDISEKLKVGVNTINSVNRWLFSGFGGYYSELKNAKNMKEYKNSIPTNDWEMIKKKYPAHFFISNLVDKIRARDRKV
ncbi:MAG: YerC/YecD family TrpR-related protein [Patescibacteria group bacterium]|nr:YerC/YecD family TrpR-related protein [Patescibacteria group bacterium]